MLKMLRCLLFFLFIPQAVIAADLMDVYQQALENDPLFKEAYSTYLSSAEAIPQAKAALYPQLTVGAQGARNNIHIISSQDITATYNSRMLQLNASQAIFNYQAWQQVSLAKAQVKAAQATFNDAAQNLILRTAKAYMDTLLAKDTLTYAVAKKAANKRQLDQAQQRFNVGLDAITSVYEAKAAYDQSIAEVIAAGNNQINQNENLRKITNHSFEALMPLRGNQVPLITPEPRHVEDWVDAGLRQNYKLNAARFSQLAAHDNIGVQAGNGMPTVAVQGSGQRLTNFLHGSSSFFVPNVDNTASVALALNFPVFQGGLVVSKTRQAKYDYETAGAKFEQAYNNVVVDSRIAFNTIVDGSSKVKADRQTVVSQQNSLESTEAQFQVGTRTMVDVVNAQQRLFDAQRQLAQDQYSYILSILNLKYLAGSLNVNDIEEVNSWLATVRINKFPSRLLSNNTH